MNQWPASPSILFPGNLISPLTRESIGSHIVSAPASAAWPLANLAIFIPFRLEKTVLCEQLFLYNGATASGNVDVGVYDHTGRLIASSGSTAQSGTNVPQLFNVTDFLLGPGLFYIAVAFNGTTGTCFRWAPASQHIGKALGLAELTSAFALPATVTLATYTRTFVPMAGLVLDHTI